MRIVEYDRLAQRSCRGRAAEHWLSRGLLGAKYSPHTSGWVEYPLHHLWCTMCANCFMNRCPCAVDDAKMDSRLRGNDTFLVAPAEAGVHASNQAGMTESRDYGSKWVMVMTCLAAFQATSLPNDSEMTRRGTIERLFLTYGAASSATILPLMTPVAFSI
jgi:L-lactate utilization protein LutB